MKVGLRFGIVFLLLGSVRVCLSGPDAALPEPLLRRLDSRHFAITRYRDYPRPRVTEFELTLEGRPLLPKKVGFERHLVRSDGATHQVREQYFLTLAEELDSGQDLRFENRRFEEKGVHPGIHVNQLAYPEGSPVVVALGLYLGDLGELPLPPRTELEVLGEGQLVERGSWTVRPEKGYPFDPGPQQQVARARLGPLPAGSYRVRVPGWGHSPVFDVLSGAARQSAHLYAAGLYHQRCGDALTGSHPRPPCHTSEVLGLGRAVLGGHHDAGDYGRYTHSSALAAHLLLFACEHWTGLSDEDHLQLPQSGDRVPDLLQIARRELDFLLQMQAEGGGFHQRLAPAERAYEHDRTAERAGPQRVLPVTATATAAAVAALAQAARHPGVRRHWPEQAQLYRRAALLGWDSLEKLVFSKSSHHYGDVFEDRDERLWATVELYLTTGEKRFRPSLEGHEELRRWGWWPVFEGYGAAARSYVFSSQGEDSEIYRRFKTELVAAAELWVRAAGESSYAVTFPPASKRHQKAGWFFVHDYSFDLVTASRLEQSAHYLEAAWDNWHYELGVNPQGHCFLTGVGPGSPRNLVHQQYRNDGQPEPPAGFPVGSIVTGPRFAGVPSDWEYPPLLDGPEGKPLEERYSDAPNVTGEATILNQVRGLLVCLFLDSSQ